MIFTALGNGYVEEQEESVAEALLIFIFVILSLSHVLTSLLQLRQTKSSLETEEEVRYAHEQQPEQITVKT
jgi:hypothetical protein